MKNQSHKNFEIEESDEGVRLDNFLSLKTDYSRSQIQNLIKSQEVLCNDKKSKSSYILKQGDNIKIDLTHIKTKIIELFQDDSLNVEIVFEDDDIIVANKPAGLVTHPGAGYEVQSLVHAFYDKLPKNVAHPERPGIVHRLDKDTQGLIVLAKNISSQENLSAQFKDKTAGRTYKALCYGKFKEPTATYTSHLKRDPKNRKRYKSQEDGKVAVTRYSVIKENELSFVELKLETGRTHQIRVHLSEDQHPILNDNIYGHPKRINEIREPKLRAFIKRLKNMPLVATDLNIKQPSTNESLSFSIPWPEEFIYENLSD